MQKNAINRQDGRAKVERKDESEGCSDIINSDVERTVNLGSL